MIEDYQKLLLKDPQSKAFAPLAEALREMKRFKEAEATAVSGIKRHPSYVGGYVALGRIMMDQGRAKESGPVLKKAIDLDPQNLLGLQLFAQFLIQEEQPKEALKIFKRILFLNPQSEKARSAVAKLESLTADEFEEDTFQYQRLHESESEINSETSSAKPDFEKPLGAAAFDSHETELDRKLSLTDAYIVRNDLEKAKVILEDLLKKYPGREDILRRMMILGDAEAIEEPTPIQPVMSRERQVIDRKIQILENILQKAIQAKGTQIYDLET